MMGHLDNQIVFEEGNLLYFFVKGQLSGEGGNCVERLLLLLLETGYASEWNRQVFSWVFLLVIHDIVWIR